MRKSTLLLANLLLLAVASVGRAQELTLFEPVEAQAADDKSAPAAGGAIVNQNGQPAYTLRSSVRIGDDISVTLVDRQGKQTKVLAKLGQRTPIPGANGYAIDAIAQRNVILVQPGNDPCLASAKQGVSCVDTSHAKLSMTMAAPVQINQAQQGKGAQATQQTPQNPFEAAIQAQQAEAAAQGVAPLPGGQGPFINPFNGRAEQGNQLTPEQQAARDARQRQRAERLNRQDQSRITDDQVPAGMRRVTTPFGDRLVPAPASP